jgi:mRNA interferase MazF
MAAYAAGDIVLLQFPFTDTAGSKRRPALVLLDTGDDDIVVARVTGQLSTASPARHLLLAGKPPFADRANR